jgi:hypothetical protein
VVESVGFLAGESQDLLGARREVVHHGVGWEWMRTGSTVSPISEGGIFCGHSLAVVPTSVAVVH